MNRTIKELSIIKTLTALAWQKKIYLLKQAAITKGNAIILNDISLLSTLYLWA